MQDPFLKYSDVEKAGVVDDFQSLIMHPGWRNFLLVIDSNIVFVTERILTKTDQNNEPIEEDQVDIYRQNLKMLRDMRNTPEAVIRQLAPQEIVEAISFDPYNDRGDVDHQSMQRP
jgi:hypothetical protein